MTGTGNTETGNTEPAKTETGTPTMTGPAADVDPAPAPPVASRGVLLRVAVAAVIGVLVVTIGWMLYLQRQDNLVEQARTDATDAAAAQAVAMLAYEFGNVDEQLAEAADGLTGSFREDYRTLVEEAIAPGAKEKKLTVQVTVQAKSVVEADADSATVLLYLNQVTTSAEAPDARTVGSRITMDLEKVDGTWLTSRLTPV
ncbi:Mce-associated membrane protein [Rhodococcus triatomae]|uniref:Mce-associated membrane protein n=2 Tax=Rhodococcus triatomae TaxID=300028 RepID=A0A1G8BAI6_9NOCA|nr:Mce-associated membrane protein [Rhodococcus triatomae]